MCLVVCRWAPAAEHPVVLVGNRDEFHARPTAPLHRWPDAAVVGGRDLAAGGTWFAAAPTGRFGVITNVRGTEQPVDAPTRGRLIPEFLGGGETPSAYLTRLAGHPDRFAGFILIVADAAGPWVYSNIDGRPPRPLGPGIHGASNSAYDAPWPKVTSARQRLAATLDVTDPRALVRVLAERTRADDEMEQRRASAFISHPVYGTRSTTTYVLDREGTAVITETNFRSDGTRERTTHITLTAP
jgi:uncharacterized protein with NRDE domain